MKRISPLLLLGLVALRPQGTSESEMTSTLNALTWGIPGYDRAKEPKPVGDEAFLLRLFRDVLGAVPTAAEIKAFLEDPDPDKRTAQVAKSVEDPRFAPFWADRFSRVFFGDPTKLSFAHLEDRPDGIEARVLGSFNRWLAERLKKDVPWTQIVQGVLDARGTTDGDPALAYKLSFYRGNGMQVEFPTGMARHFLGIRLDCARCHDHPYEKWRVEDLYGLAAFAARQRVRRDKDALELKYGEDGEATVPGTKAGKAANVKVAQAGTIAPNFLFGGTCAGGDDRMQALATFMTARTTPQFTRAWVNRIWGWFFGYGIVEPVDDFGFRNKPLSNPLLEALVKDTQEGNHSLKRLVRVICTTASYQLPTPEEDPLGITFRHLAKARKGPTPYTRDFPAPPVSHQLPEDWIHVRARYGARILYLVPVPTEPLRTLELGLFPGKVGPSVLESLKRQCVDLKAAPKDTVIDGKVRITWSEFTGTFPCDPSLDGPTVCQLWFAAFEAPNKASYYFRFQGPTAQVEACREKFTTYLKSLGK